FVTTTSRGPSLSSKCPARGGRYKLLKKTMSEEISYPARADYYEPISVHVVPRQTIAYRLPVFLFLLTILTTLFWGAYWMVLYQTRGQAVDPMQFFRQVLLHPELLWKGLGYSSA